MLKAPLEVDISDYADIFSYLYKHLKPPRTADMSDYCHRLAPLLFMTTTLRLNVLIHHERHHYLRSRSQIFSLVKLLQRYPILVDSCPE
jgi:hypothetical protein